MKRQAFLTCLVVTAVVKIAVFFGLIIFWRWQRSTPIYVGKVESIICIRNDTFVSSAGKSDMMKGLERRDDKVCGQLSDFLDGIIKQMVVEKFDSKLCPVQWKASKVYWQSGTTAVPELMHLEGEGAVYIKKAGLYYVSSHLTFETEIISKNKTTWYSDVSTKHIVYAISHEKGGQVTLMERSMSPCEITTESSEQTSHMAAVFNFQERDRIFVATSHTGSLIKGKGRNYLTVYSI